MQSVSLRLQGNIVRLCTVIASTLTPCLPTPPLTQISRLCKTNGSRARTVVITQGAQPTIVAVNGRVTLHTVPKVRERGSGV